MVQLVSVVTGHTRVAIRPRLNDKLECLKYDPMIQDMCIYRETKKIKSMKY